MSKTDLELVTRPEAVADSIRSFNQEAQRYRDRAKALLAETTYWVVDSRTGSFGPGKFVGFVGMDFPTYEAAHRHEIAGASFNGTATRVAIARAVGRKFQPDPTLVGALKTWGRQLLGTAAFGKADETKWRFIALDQQGRDDTPRPSADAALPLTLHERYTRGEIFESVGVKYTSRNQHQNTGLSPRCPDGGYFVFITLNKADFDPRYDYEDELFADHVRWVTRRDRAEDHPDYAALRSPVTRVSLFVRNNADEEFAYLGGLHYEQHRQFTSQSSDGRVQQEYVFRLAHEVTDSLLSELTAGVKQRNRRTTATPAPHRRPASLDDYKKALAYSLGRLERTLIPAHYNYQVRLKKFLDSKGIRSEWERDYVDLRFEISGVLHIGEIKVTTCLRLDEAFRMALGQLLEYGCLKCEDKARLVMFLDQQLDDRRLALASRLGVAVVAEPNASSAYTFQNPSIDSALAEMFATQATPRL